MQMVINNKRLGGLGGSRGWWVGWRDKPVNPGPGRLGWLAWFKMLLAWGVGWGQYFVSVLQINAFVFRKYAMLFLLDVISWKKNTGGRYWPNTRFPHHFALKTNLPPGAATGLTQEVFQNITIITWYLEAEVFIDGQICLWIFHLDGWWQASVCCKCILGRLWLMLDNTRFAKGGKQLIEIGGI